jgi:uncharacterized PurR-regulated membrane protein YhhQ (DUF165 family)
MEILWFYLTIGLGVNLATMSECWEGWVEFGLVGFIMQLIISILLFPFILYVNYIDHQKTSD